MRYHKLAACLIASALTLPLTAPLARADDKADVRAVATTVVNAIIAGDHNTLADNFVDAAGPDEQLADPMTDVIAASKALHDAEVTKFGAENTKASQFDPQKLTDQLKNSTVNVTGDTAELAPNSTMAPPHSGMQFKRDGGKWKLVSLTGQTGGRLVMLKILKPMTFVMNAVAGEVNDGKYASAAEADTAVKTKVVDMMKKSGLVPATKPAAQ